ncbi:hypothetical protein J7E93_17025 [Streptomyces sp. ISL-36]|uniref:hypothetical protein n=1 Tax=Streptomyces sp. ISL-36 TaxID=2819182 RepID=UPI001BEAEF38|nr:hypothetical protein [Streptomyces sp. ISL-36]MBT2441785.1 hypothetical protein [Streptomyces sp. ISL-36]
MRRMMAAIGAAAALAGLISAAGPATASAGAACRTAPTALGALPGTEVAWPKEGVRALGRGNLSVGSSRGKAVYWTGTTVHRVPVPDSRAESELLGVNQRGLMVGRYRPYGTTTQVGFTYRAGDASVTELPGGAQWGGDLDVNDSGRVVAGGYGDRTIRVYADGALERTLTLPEELGPDTYVYTVGGINSRGDVVATVQKVEPDTGGRVEHSYPVLWPGDEGPAQILPQAGGGGNTSWVAGIAADGTIVGSDWYGPGYEWTPWVWSAPLGTPGSSPGRLSTHPYASLDGVSPTTGVAVGAARSHPDDAGNGADQAVLWPGSGPMLALPRLAAGQASEAVAVSDDDRAGGSAVNASGATRAVVWTCASRQAYLPS